MTGIKRGLFGAGLLGMITVVCWAYALLTANDLVRQYAGISVRLFETTVPRQTLEKVLEQTNGGELACTAAWTRSDGNQMAGSELGGKTALRVVCVYGDMRQVAPMKLLRGAIPVEGDTEGCLLDATSACALFHSIDAVGAQVTLGELHYIVRGIAETYEPVLMIRNEQASFENLEFAVQNPDGAKQSVETFLYRCGGSVEYTVVQSGMIARIIRGVAWLPLWIAGICSAAALVKRGWGMRTRLAKSVQYWIAAAAIAALVCYGLTKTASWPQSFLPTKWSDFAFWGELLNTCKLEAKTYALMTQTPKEIELFSAARRCIVALLVSILSGGWCVSAARRNSRNVSGKS